MLICEREDLPDYAMNWLPAKYRQSQREWFGLKGIMWHICAYQYFVQDDITKSTSISNQVHIQVFREDPPKDVSTQLALFWTSITVFCKANPHV